jgi:hypothetical protein
MAPDLNHRNSHPVTPISSARCDQTHRVRTIGRITRQPSSNGSPGSAYKSRKDVQSQICLPTELLDIGRVKTCWTGRSHSSPGDGVPERVRQDVSSHFLLVPVVGCWGPRRVQRICCFFSIRQSTSWSTVDSTALSICDGPCDIPCRS